MAASPTPQQTTKVQDLKQDGGVLLSCLREPSISDPKKPPSESKVFLHLKGFVIADDSGPYEKPLPILSTHDDSPFTFNVGTEQSIPGMDICVAEMLETGVYQIEIKPKYGFGEFGNPNGFHSIGKGIPRNATLRFEVHFLGFLEPKSEPQLWQMNDQQKLKYAEEMKEKGNSFFKLKQYERAYIAYSLSVEAFSRLDNKSEHKEKNGAVLTNIAAVRLLSKNYGEVISACTNALQLDPKNMKALFRRAKAHFAKKNFEDAKTDLRKGLEIEKNNKDFLTELAAVKKVMEKEKEKEKKLFSGFFQKFEEKDMGGQSLYGDVKEETTTKCPICNEEVDKIQLNRHIVKKHSEKPKVPEKG